MDIAKAEDNKIKNLLFFLILIVYALSARGHVMSSDSSYSLAASVNLIENGSFSIDNGESWFITANNGKVYSPYGIGIALIWAPFILFAKFVLIFFPMLPSGKLYSFIISFANIFFGSGISILIYRMLREKFSSSPISATSTTLLVALATPIWHYSVSDFSECAQAFFLLSSVYFSLDRSLKGSFYSSLSFFVLILIKPVNIILFPAIFIYLLVGSKKISTKSIANAWLAAIIVSLASLLVLLVNYQRYGHPFNFGNAGISNPQQFGYRSAFALSYIPEGFYVLLISLNKGILIFCPLIILGIIGYISFYNSNKREALLFIGICLLNLLTYAAWCSDGGWCLGPRFLVTALPLYLIPICKIKYDKKIIYLFATTLVIISFVIQLLGAAQSYHEYYYLDTKFKERGYSTPSTIPFLAKLANHKILYGDNVYRLSEFGIDSEKTITTHNFESYRGFNIWYLHLSRYYKMPALSFFPILFMPVLIFLIFRLVCLCSTEKKLFS